MNKLIAILLIAGACWAAWTLRNFYLEKEAESSHQIYDDPDAQPAGFNPKQLPGLHYTLEMPLETATRGGAASLKKFLDQYRGAIQDPRRAWIELDYVTLVGLRDPAQARAIFAEVKQRTPTNSLIYFRVAKLAKLYE